MDLVIVESPTKAKTLSRFLGREYVIEASMGHVRDLPEKGGGLAIDVEHNFEPTYQVLSSKKKRVAELKKLAKNAGTIYLATDPDREGEAIAYHVEFLLKGENPKSKNTNIFKRVTFHEITKTAIQEALQHPGIVNMDLVNAQQARRVLDRLVGYTLSPVLWKKVRRGLSAGRVQSVAVRLIVEREAEIKAFKPDEYWEIYVDLSTKSEMLRVELSRINGRAVKITSNDQASAIVGELNSAQYVVSAVTQDEQKSSPLPPFTTSLLQRAGSNMFGYSAKQTMQIAQSLYERGLITYHRTDSYNLAAEAVASAREYISRTYGAEYVPDVVRVYKTKAASAQEAHEAIRPTDVSATPTLEGRDKKLYELIRARFLQCQMSDARFDKTTVLIDAKVDQGGQYELKADVKRLIFDGYMKLGRMSDDVFLPQVASGQTLQLTKVDPVQKFTQPPARFSEASIIKELEKRGIGRPSTYAAIISTIQDRGYVTKEEKRFYPTAVGEAVVAFLVTNFESVMAYEFTAGMEQDLDLVAEGKKEWVTVVREFWKPLSTKVANVEETGARVKVAVEGTGDKCPTCLEGEVVIRTGKFGKFLSCSRYPDCTYKAQYVEYAPGGVLCPTCGGRVVIKKSRKGKFYGCEKYPTCTWAAWKLPVKAQASE